MAADRDGTRAEGSGRAEPTLRRDFRQDLTDQIVQLVEQGTAPFQKPWRADAAGDVLAMPRNATTGRRYRGGNAVLLLMRAQALGSSDPRWCTYKQAQERGWQVRKGSRGTGVEYWKFDREEVDTDPVTGKPSKRTVRLDEPRVFYATVFHASQIDGIEPYLPPPRPEGWTPVQAAEEVLAGSGARILHDQADGAYYSPALDEIHLPAREAFPEPLDYYEVALHELAHWSGHASRLGRDLTGGFGSPSYAREELRAQMASLFMSAELGVPFNPERHAAYQASWVKALQDDKHEIFRAARDAEAMADFVVGLSQGLREEDRILEPQPESLPIAQIGLQAFDSAKMTQAAPGISRERAEHLVAEFLAEYKGFGPEGRVGLKIVLLETERDFHELYGPNAEAARREWAVPGRKACFHPTLGTVAIALDGVLHDEDFRRSLSHEGIGHSGLLTFTEGQKRAVLEALIRARAGDDFIARTWGAVDGNPDYARLSLLRRAEEVYGLVCEELPRLPHVFDPAAHEHVWRHSIESDRERLQTWGLIQVIQGVAQGLREDRLVQQIFPLSDDAQFRVDDRTADRSELPATSVHPSFQPARSSSRAGAAAQVRLSAIDEFAAELRAAGLVLDGPPKMDGEFHYVPVLGEKPGKLSGSYWGTLEGLPQGFVRNLANGLKLSWRYDGPIQKPNQGKVQQQVAQRAAEEWAQLPEATSSHAFLHGKGIDGHGLKVDQDGRLVMALADVDGRLWSLLRINDSGETAITDGGRFLGCFGQVGPEDAAKPIVIAESYAAAATVHEATGLPTVSALNAGNLEMVAQAMRVKHPERQVFIAGEIGHLTELAAEANAAKSRFAKTAQAIGAHLLLPRFGAEESGTDWNDLAASRGVEHVREQLVSLMAPHGLHLDPDDRTENAIEAGPIPVEIRNDLADGVASPQPSATSPAAQGSDVARPSTLPPEPPTETRVPSLRQPILTKTGYQVPPTVAARYVVRDGAYWGAQEQAPGKKAGSTQPHFEDKGPKLITDLQDRRTVADMVAVAQAKNWDSITVKGSEEFRRHAWVEGSLAGVVVHGFKPQEADRALLDAARRERDDALRISGGTAPEAEPAPEVNTVEVAAEQPLVAPAQSANLAAAAEIPTTAPAAAVQPPAAEAPVPTIADVRAILARTIEHIPEATLVELMTRMNERLRAGVDVQDRVARGEWPKRSLGEVLRAQMSKLTFGTATGPDKTPAGPTPTTTSNSKPSQVIR